MILRLGLLLLLIRSGFAQDQPALWHVSIVKPDTLKKDEVVLKVTSDLDAGWEVYASDFEAPIGPLPTALELDGKETVCVGTLKSDKPLHSIDPAWSIGYTYFENQAIFYQQLKVGKSDSKIRGKIKGQYINKKNRHVRDFEEEFVVEFSQK